MAATLTITDNASGSPQIVFLNGAGVYPVTVAVTPSATNVTTAQAFTVTVAVGGANGEPTPTGFHRDDQRHLQPGDGNAGERQRHDRRSAWRAGRRN
jgi:hypothetical protein